MNGLHNVHYHNSVHGVDGFAKDCKYQPNTSIIAGPLTEKYNVEGEIGRGKFAVVKKCVNKENGHVVAAKCIRKRRRGKSCREEILREVVMLEMALEHPRLVDLKEVFETQSELVLITEYCSGGELFTECVIEESFNEKDVVRMMVQILEGLVYLHERNIVHLDLKPQNILLTKPFPHGSIKLCDLGFACLVNTGEDIRDIIGTPDYVAPEVLSYEPLGLYTDMWSLGVLTYVMLTACSPFSGSTQNETFLNISQVNLEFPENLFSNISKEAQDFITKLLVKEPSERLTAKQCLEHPWIKNAHSEVCKASHSGQQVIYEGASSENVITESDPETWKDSVGITGSLLNECCSDSVMKSEDEKEEEDRENRIHNKSSTQESDSRSKSDISSDSKNESNRTDGEKVYRTHLEIISTNRIYKCNSTDDKKTRNDDDFEDAKKTHHVNVCCSQECQTLELELTDDVNSNRDASTLI